MQTLRRTWTRAIEDAKNSHWKEFLDQAGKGNLWKAAKYTYHNDQYAPISPLTAEGRTATTSEDKAQMLLETFFPTPTEPVSSMEPSHEAALEWEALTKAEIHQSLFAASGKSAAGLDSLPMLVWQKLWPYISDTVYQIFTASLELGHHPTTWRTAAIVVLRKPQKADMTVPICI